MFVTVKEHTYQALLHTHTHNTEYHQPSPLRVKSLIKIRLCPASQSLIKALPVSAHTMSDTHLLNHLTFGGAKSQKLHPTLLLSHAF